VAFKSQDDRRTEGLWLDRSRELHLPLTVSGDLHPQVVSCHVSDVMPTNSRPLPLLKVSILPPDVSPNDLLNRLWLSGVFVRRQLQILDPN
jgi:hypothetical protein